MLLLFRIRVLVGDRENSEEEFHLIQGEEKQIPSLFDLSCNKNTDVSLGVTLFSKTPESMFSGVVCVCVCKGPSGS